MHKTFDLVIRTPESEIVAIKAESLYVATEVGDMAY